MVLWRKGGLLATTAMAGLLGCTEQAHPVALPQGQASSAVSAQRYPVDVSVPPTLKGLLTGGADLQGEPMVVRCETCHQMLPPNAPLPTRAQDAKGPHKWLVMNHGDLQCGSCHEATDRSQLHLATGEKVPLVQAMRLCAQCHGSQRRDYQHGAHGGMRGYWDLSKGGQQRNHCVSCHDPHQPAYPHVLPAPPPRDRFSQRGGQP